MRTAAFSYLDKMGWLNPICFLIFPLHFYICLNISIFVMALHAWTKKRKMGFECLNVVYGVMEHPIQITFSRAFVWQLICVKDCVWWLIRPIFFFFRRNAAYVSAHMRMEQSSMLYPATIISILHALWNGLRWMQHVLSASTTFSREMNRYEERE